ncbi:MAG: oxidative damage protection protein [Gammaproteobacteria bacterium]|nr:oxidative damage protection protein [Gammaproteobacteria bacterium]
MSRMVFCRKLKKELPGLARAPFPGAKGEDLLQNISQQAWDEWQTHQTMIINERHLNMMDADDRKFVMQEMEKFFAGEDFARAEGYVPPSDN